MPTGVKIFALCESTTGFILNALVACDQKYQKTKDGHSILYGTIWELIEWSLVPGAMSFLHQGFQVSTLPKRFPIFKTFIWPSY